MSDESTAPAASAEVTVTPVGPAADSGVEVVDVTPESSSEVVEEVIAPEPPPVVEPPKEKVASKLARAKEREAAAAKREAIAEAKLAEAKAMLDEANSKSSLVESLKTNPSKVLSQLGITFNDLANAILSEDVQEESTPSELDGLKQSLEDIRKELKSKEDREKAAYDEAQDRVLQAAIADIKVVIDNHLRDNAEKYDLINVTGNNELVYEIMKESFDQTGEVMMYTEACDLAEEYLTNKAKTLANSRKIKEFVSPAVADKPKRTSFGNTLSAQATQVAASTGKGMDLSRLPHEERIKILAKQLKFN